MIPTEILMKLRQAMREIAAERGAFTLFGIFVRPHPAGACDLVVSAPWLQSDKLAAVAELARLVSAHGGADALTRLASIQTVDDQSPAVEAVLAAVDVDDGEVRIHHPDFFGIDIEEAVIMRARRAA